MNSALQQFIYFKYILISFLSGEPSSKGTETLSGFMNWFPKAYVMPPFKEESLCLVSISTS